MDLLDLYRGDLTYRRLCVLVTHLPADAAVWRVHHPDGGHTRTELLVAAVERRVALLWATVAAALGHQIPEEHLTGPLDSIPAIRSDPERELNSLREIAAWMRS
ncbi:hypothetical protein [Actinokineospora terrae]|uniref:Uncharacterized protein n=1 Tax=Actinokineospora terrae TaxID=155974 RepID=A0A1H9XTP6_9PSEU|nr:hypothetical protein [Actinokineospora terrae]SES49063.1 hypothetical protein SAMN04487818_1249 [Actinokineospora terrae]